MAFFFIPENQVSVPLVQPLDAGFWARETGAEAQVNGQFGKKIVMAFDPRDALRAQAINARGNEFVAGMGDIQKEIVLQSAIPPMAALVFDGSPNQAYIASNSIIDFTPNRVKTAQLFRIFSKETDNATAGKAIAPGALLTVAATVRQSGVEKGFVQPGNYVVTQQDLDVLTLQNSQGVVFKMQMPALKRVGASLTSATDTLGHTRLSAASINALLRQKKPNMQMALQE